MLAIWCPVKWLVLTRFVRKDMVAFQDCLRKENLMLIYCDLLEKMLTFAIVNRFTLLDSTLCSGKATKI